LGDPVVATAILDRLLHHSHVLSTRGERYRLKEKRRAGLFGRATAATNELALGQEATGKEEGAGQSHTGDGESKRDRR
jgi:hypothetical protein